MNLSDEQIYKLKKALNDAEPYEDNAPELSVYDGKRNSKRFMSTLAKKWLEQDAKEKTRTKN